MEPEYYKFDSGEMAFFVKYDNGKIKKLKRMPSKNWAYKLVQHPNKWHQYFPGPSGGHGSIKI